MPLILIIQKLPGADTRNAQPSVRKAANVATPRMVAHRVNRVIPVSNVPHVNNVNLAPLARRNPLSTVLKTIR